MPKAVFDASALLALILDEPGADFVAGFTDGSLISAVNLQEVFKVLLFRGMPQDLARSIVDGMGIKLCVHTAEDAWAAARLCEETKSKGCSLGDRTCMALAIKEGLPALTADRIWTELSIPGLEVILAR